jgi:outer membrane murein-binding lipoprotein Lpp
MKLKRLPTVIAILASATLLAGCTAPSDSDSSSNEPALPAPSVSAAKENSEEKLDTPNRETPNSGEPNEELPTSEPAPGDEDNDSQGPETTRDDPNEPAELIKPVEVPETETIPETGTAPATEEEPEPQPEPAPEPAPESEATPATVQSHIDAATYTDLAEEIYLSTSPTILDPASLESECSGGNSTDPGRKIAGCYVFPPGNIYIKDITDARVSDSEIVTAAHEMLHAAWYGDMTSAERSDIGNQLQSWFNRLPSDHWLNEKLAAYSSESIPTELHSILGTETADLTPSLEAHYSRYFNDRAAVVGLADGVGGYMRNLDAEISILKSQLSELRSSLQSRDEELTSMREQLDNEIAEFNADVDAGKYENNYEEYEETRATLNSRQDQIQADFTKLYSDFDSFNELVVEYNAKVNELNSLSKSLTQ